MVGSDIDKDVETPVDVPDLSAMMADGTGYKQQKGKKRELRSVLGITTVGNVEPLGIFANTAWVEVEQIIKERFKQTKDRGIPFYLRWRAGSKHLILHKINVVDVIAPVACNIRCEKMALKKRQ